MLRTLPLFAVVFVFAVGAPGFGFAETYDGWSDFDHDEWDDPDHDCADHEPADASNPQQKLASKFAVDESQIAGLRDENLGYGEIDHTLTLAERLPGGITSENVDQILYLRQDQHMGWGQIAKAQDTTLGTAKREFPTQPAAEPKPVSTTEQASIAQPKSLSRPGKSSPVTSGRSASASGHGSKGSGKSQSSSNRSAKAVTASTSPTRGGHAYGRGSSGGSSGKANGKAKGSK